MALIIKLWFLLTVSGYVSGLPATHGATTNSNNSNTANRSSSLSNASVKLTKLPSPLKRHFFRNKNISCNDGTTAGYYLKKSHHSKTWVIYLEGGWYCFSDRSCEARMRSNVKELMSSDNWQPKRAGLGILSSNPEINPTWWNANRVLVPYCSSDAWSGNVSRLESGGNFSFMGYRIVNEVIKELSNKGLLSAKQVLLAGSSAGGIGVIISLDRVAKMMASAGSTAVVRGISDSGWFVERKMSPCKTSPQPKACLSDIIGRGMNYWKGVVPKQCAAQFPTEPWRCYFGNNVQKTLKRPLFIFQWQYDTTQLIVENVGSGLAKGGQFVRNLFKLAKEIKLSLKNSHVSGAFIPACVSHTTLTVNNWLSVKVRKNNLDNAINCWITEDELKMNGLATIPTVTCKFIDTCGHPQCNCRCPVPRDPFTGKIMTAQSMSPFNGISVKPNDNNSFKTDCD